MLSLDTCRGAEKRHYLFPRVDSIELIVLAGGPNKCFLLDAIVDVWGCVGQGFFSGRRAAGDGNVCDGSTIRGRHQSFNHRYILRYPIRLYWLIRSLLKQRSYRVDRL